MAIKSLSAYQNDSDSIKYFNNGDWGTDIEMRKQSPIHESLAEKKDAEGRDGGYTVHSYSQINPYKICEISIDSFNKGGQKLLKGDQKWGNWRWNDPKDIKKGLKVKEKVLLWTESKEWEFSFTNNYESAYAKLSEQGGFSKVQQANEMARSFAILNNVAPESNLDNGGRMISKYKEAPAWTGALPLQLPGSLTFKFRFGQAGDFSGCEEVVKPIMALALPFSPRLYGEHKTYAKGPWPTAPTYFFEYINNFKEELPEIGTQITGAIKRIGDAGGIGEKFGEIIQGLTKLEESIIDTMNKTIEDVLEEGTFLHVRIGRMTLPPLIVKDVRWKFNMTHTDEYGYPLEGQITFGNLETTEFANSTQIDDIFK